MMQVIVDILVSALIILSGYVMSQYVIPFVKDNHLETVARMAVNFAEAAIGAGHGEEKFKLAVKQVEETWNIHLPIEKIEAAIQAKWLELDQEQKAEGLKTAE